MREIKFRAWDKEREELLPVTQMDWPEWRVSCEPVIDGIVHPLDYGERNSFKNENTDRHILMQYTGLKDKNGVEIYEGDIIKSETLPNRIGGSYPIRDIVEFHYIMLDSAMTPSDAEVIGNIYENPERITE